MGIPTVKREKGHYLINTLHSLLNELSEEQKNDCVVIVLVAEVSVHGEVQCVDRKTIQRCDSVGDAAKCCQQGLWQGFLQGWRRL